MKISLESTQGNLIFPSISHFPDGQLLLNEDLTASSWEICTASITNAEELLAVSQIVQTLTVKELHIAYLYGMRSDRPFKVGQPHYLRDIIGPVFSNMISPFVSKIVLYTPHSDVAISVIPKSTKADVMPELIDLIIQEHTEKPLIIILPDSGAEKRWGDYIDSKSLKKTIAFKRRTAQGVEIEFPVLPDPDHTIVLVDDLCDGGATFKAVADSLSNNQLILAVAHLLNNPHQNINLQKFSEIYTVNNIHSKPPEYLQQSIFVRCLPLFPF